MVVVSQAQIWEALFPVDWPRVHPAVNVALEVRVVARAGSSKIGFKLCIYCKKVEARVNQGSNPNLTQACDIDDGKVLLLDKEAMSFLGGQILPPSAITTVSLTIRYGTPLLSPRIPKFPLK